MRQAARTAAVAVAVASAPMSLRPSVRHPQVRPERVLRDIDVTRTKKFPSEIVEHDKAYFDVTIDDRIGRDYEVRHAPACR